MRSIVLLSFYLCVCVGNRFVDVDFTKWKHLNTKEYVSKTMEQEAYSYFLQDKQAIDEHNKNYAKGEVSFTRAINKYSDWSPARKQQWLNGFVLNTTTQEAYEYYLGLVIHESKKKVQERLELPDLVDWRLLGSVTPVQDQGNQTISSPDTILNLLPIKDMFVHHVGHSPLWDPWKDNCGKQQQN